MGAYALAQAGSPDALAALVRRHIPLVQALTKRFSFSEDAFQWGCIGLVQAIRRYREDGGCQFSTYAVPVILGEMRRAFSHTLGWRARAALKKARQFQQETLLTAGREPTMAEMARHAGIRPEELLLLMERDQPPVYDETGVLLSSLPDPRGDSWLTALLIRDILDRMQAEESWLIRQRWAVGRSQQEIARALRTTQSTVSRKEKSARMHFRSAWLDDQS
ncbi:MAG: sigma-70 family RNA polymerase sigma factor [Clostridia bacterium]|nr:sigma-70 family RNA polymerase sigma factor [Clostridia bacterium]